MGWQHYDVRFVEVTKINRPTAIKQKHTLKTSLHIRKTELNYVIAIITKCILWFRTDWTLDYVFNSKGKSYFVAE